MARKTLTRAEVAAMLRVKEQTIAKWGCSRPQRGPRFVIRRHRAVYRLDDVFAWLADPAAHEAGHHRDEREDAGTKK